ncbi:MAG: diguanylate cyclase [Nevskia sp.]|nr:diguanylate cyclase [Nevskia sp.]
MNASQEFVIFSQSWPANSHAVVAGSAAHRMADYREFAGSGLKPCAFIVKDQDELYVGRMLRAIRRDPDHATRLAFVDGVVGASEQPLADGALPENSQALLERLQQSRSRAAAMRRRNDDRGPDSLLLEYMWLRPGYVLEPVADWRHPRRYRFPILEAFDHSESDADVWLQRLDKAGLIERVALRERQRECDHCGSAHLCFIDVCPGCRSIDIDAHTALHCFTCGLIAPEERFVQRELRICPKCGARLRHIGSDYDRPLETSVCAACDHVFVEGEVIARCAICGRSQAPPALRLRKIHSWRLSGAGCLAAQGGAPAARGGAGGPARYVDSASFGDSLEWALRLTRENAAGRFALLGLRLDNLAQLDTALGAGRAARLLDACAERLCEALADADVATRADLETIRVLLANADRKRLGGMRQAVQAMASQAMQDQGLGPQWRLAELPITAAVANRGDGNALLAQLQQSLRGGRRHAPALG